MMQEVVYQTELPGLKCQRGKVRDVYDLGEMLVIVATDRISAFDWIMPTPIPGKGKILTELTLFWLEFLKVPNHLISIDITDYPAPFREYRERFAGRSMLVRKTKVVPVECVARGYLAGSGWKEYRSAGTICGIPLPAGLLEASRLSEPVFTPATKAEQGLHDENISFEVMARQVGLQLATELKQRTLAIYQRAADYALTRGLILADTKFEWGILPSGEMILIDEVLTPDSSRFWPSDTYRPNSSPLSFDKQFLRDWLEQSGWDKMSPPPALPDSVVKQTADKYAEALVKLTGKAVPG